MVWCLVRCQQHGASPPPGNSECPKDKHWGSLQPSTVSGNLGRFPWKVKTLSSFMRCFWRQGCHSVLICSLFILLEDFPSFSPAPSARKSTETQTQVNNCAAGSRMQPVYQSCGDGGQRMENVSMSTGPWTKLWRWKPECIHIHGAMKGAVGMSFTMGAFWQKQELSQVVPGG